jgi:ribonuclease D
VGLGTPANQREAISRTPWRRTGCSAAACHPAQHPLTSAQSLNRTIQLDLPKDQGSSDWGTETLTPAQLIYSAHDVYHLHDVLRAHEAEMGKDNLLTAWKLEQRLAPIVVEMTNRGFGFNLDGVAEAKTNLETRLAEAKRRALLWFDQPGLNLSTPPISQHFTR